MIPSIRKIGLYLLVCSLASANADDNNYPANVFSRGAPYSSLMLVDKVDKIGHLIELENDTPQAIKQYDGLMFGENDGHKMHEGDKRTPEGVYQITGFLPDEELDPRYGSGAFPLNYPNPVDRIEGRNGSGIWLHGRDEEDLVKEVTRGCVAFTNQDIVELQPLLKQKTEVVISSDIKFLSAADYQAERKQVLGTLDSFITNWQNGDFNALKKQVHPNFRSASGQSGKDWLRRKRWIHQATPRRFISTDEVLAMKESGDQLVFQFVQSYCAKNIYTRGKKRLFFKRDKDKLKLITERYSPLKPIPISPKSVMHFVEHWLNSWNQGDIRNYLASYDNSFVDSRGRNLRAFSRYKKGIFSQRPDQRIEISDIKITPLKANQFRVRFEQHYTSKAYTDLGNKTLIINACADEMFIEKETWRKI